MQSIRPHMYNILVYEQHTQTTFNVNEPFAYSEKHTYEDTRTHTHSGSSNFKIPLTRQHHNLHSRTHTDTTTIIIQRSKKTAQHRRSGSTYK